MKEKFKNKWQAPVSENLEKEDNFLKDTCEKICFLNIQGTLEIRNEGNNLIKKTD